MIRVNKKLIREFLGSRPAFILLIAYLGITFAIFLHASLQYYFDVIIARGDTSFFDYVWCGYTTASTTGYGDVVSTTIPSKIATIIIMYHIVIGLFTWFISAIIESMLTFKERRLKGMHESTQTNGIVIFNFPGLEKMTTLIDEIRSTLPKIPICVIDPDIEKLPMQITEKGNIHFVCKSLISKEAISFSKVKDAKWIFIFPSNMEDPDSDAITYAIFQKLSHLEYTNKCVRIIPWVVNPENQELFKERLSSIVMGDLPVKLMVQEATDKFVGKAIDTLLKNTEDANPETFKAGNLAGLTWGDLQYGIWKYNETRSGKDTLNPLALVKDGNPVWTPPNAVKIDPDDHLLIACFPNYNWEQIESAIVDVFNKPE